MSEEIDCRYTDELVCPYCGEKHEDDGEMNEAGEHECRECGKRFRYEVDFSKSYTSRQVPCMNGAEHDWKPAPQTYFPEYKYCRACDERHVGKPVIPSSRCPNATSSTES